MTKTELLNSIYDKLANNTKYYMFNADETEEFYIDSGNAEDPAIVINWKVHISD